jgi:uncharacterized membrane protein (DUF4010 family)
MNVKRAMIFITVLMAVSLCLVVLAVHNTVPRLLAEPIIWISVLGADLVVWLLAYVLIKWIRNRMGDK